MNFKTRNVIAEVVSALFILLFIYASLSKVQEYDKFKLDLDKSPLLNSISNLIAVAVPIMELIIAAMLIIKQVQFIALHLAFMLMVAFSAYIMAILNFSPYVPCSCGGILENMSWNQHLAFNLLFVLLAGATILIYLRREKKLLQW